MVRVFQEKKLDIVNCKEKGENMKRIVQICLIMTGIFWGAFHVYGSSTYQILKDQQIEFMDILVEGDSLVLVRNEKNGFSSEGTYLGVYNCVERMWIVEYQAYDEYLESSYYAGDGIFALSDGETTTLLNTKTQEFLKLDINVNFYNLHFYNGCAVSGARESYGDQLYGIYEIDEAGNYQNTGITDFITENKILNPDDFEFVYADGKQAVYIYDGEEFYIYNVATAEVYDIYNPDYADKFWHGWTDTLKVSICGEKYLVLLNMEGTDGQNYYAVMDFYGSMITEATKCDLAIATEKGNIVVKNGDGLNEIELAKLETPEEQSLNLMPLLETNRSWRNEQTAGMDIQGNTYGNAIEYSFVTNPFGTEEYSTCDAWYLGGNYSRLTGTWYFPADQIQDGFAHIRLIGDGNVIYDNSELNADNCQIDFDIDVSGIRELSFEYNGICDMTDILFGMSDAKLYS